MNLSRILQSVALAMPARPAISSPGVALTYGEFEDQVARIAGALVARHGLRRGDRVGIWMENCAELFPVMLGVWRAGLAAVPINNKLHPKELQWILDNSGAKLCVVTPDLADKLSELPTGTSLPPIIATGTRDYASLLQGDPIMVAPADPEAEAWLFYTSGTTGRPKGAVLTHRNLLFMLHAYYADIDFLGPDDTTFHAAPMTHGSGLYGLAFILKGGNNVVVPGSFDPEQIFAALKQHRNVSFFAAPTMVSRLINHPLAGSADTRNLKTITYGGAPMYLSDLKRALEIFGPKLFQVYGQGESPMTITGLPKAMHVDDGSGRLEARLMGAGMPRTGCAVRVVGEDGCDLPVGEIGEIITRSDCVMAGYLNNPEANAKSLRDGWLWTGDMGSLDGDGFLTLKDRSKDMIISGGSNIYPCEIEEVLLTHTGVLECAVVSRPHADWGEEVIAFVVARAPGSVDTGALDRLCLDNIARYKRPKGYRIVEGLPKNNYGKILKTELRETLKGES
ncbi:MAG: AMP-binding protein [Hyphomicrobiaceae bacterium]|nr:AMP-binding protein [Hyphomicrobiaceae bacterium]